MWINASPVEGERARDDASQLFLRGFARKRRSPGEIISMEKRIRNSITAEEQEAYRDGVPILGQQIEQRFILELQEHLKYCLMHGLENLDIEFFLHKNKALNRGRDVVGVLVRCLTKRTPRDSFTPPLLSSPALPSCASQPVSSAPCTTCGRRGASKEKKSVGSWFVAESAPLGGELSLI